MKTASLLLTICAALVMSGCNFGLGKAERLVPEDWIRLPENGKALHPGSQAKLGASVDRIFEAYSQALEPLASPAEASAGAKGELRRPIDWVPWRLAGIATDFALTAGGVFGALLFEGTAAVQANWVRTDPSQSLMSAVPTSAERAATGSALALTGAESPGEVARSLEPALRAAARGGTIRDEALMRRNVLAAAQRFRAMAGGLSRTAIHTHGASFSPTAFRLEVTIGADGQLTPYLGAGGEVGFRFDWMRTPSSARRARPASGPAVVADKMAQGLEAFVRSITPDLEAAAAEAKAISTSGFALEGIRIGVGLSAEADFGVAKTAASAMGSIMFGSDAADCYDPDGDGDCHRTLPGEGLAAGVPTDDGIRLIDVSPPAGHLEFAAAEGIAVEPGGQRKGVAYRIAHDRFRAGLMRAVRLAGFFVEHAAKARHGAWKIQELAAEFEVSAGGTMGLATLTGGGEVELEFMNRRM